MIEQRLEIDAWLGSFPAEGVEREIETILAEIDRLKEQVRRRREVLKIYNALESGVANPDSIGAARRNVASMRGKSRDGA